jgi:hypothetical protein
MVDHRHHGEGEHRQGNVAMPPMPHSPHVLLNDFDNIWIDCLNGDCRETGKKTPTGDPDPSVFSTKFNPAGIRLGTTIGLFTRKLMH